MSLELSGTTGVKGVAGSVSAPSIVGDDTNTGISFPAADTIKFSTGGVERMSITNSGVSGVGGKVLQVISVVDDSAQQTINTTSYTDLGSLAVTITPSSSSNKVLIMTQVNVQIYAAHQESNGHSRVVRGSTELIEYPYFAVHEAGKSPSNRTVRNINHFQMYLDSPSTTSATTYKPQLKLTNTSYGQVLYYNQNTSKSVITAMEIAA